MNTTRDSIVEKCVQQIMRLHGDTGVPYQAVQFAKAEYLENNFYEYMENCSVEDISGVSAVIMLYYTQHFISFMDFVHSVYKLECTDTPTVEDYKKTIHGQVDVMKQSLREFVKLVIANARKLEEPKMWKPQLLPVINEILFQKYHDAIVGLKAIGHDCNKCHIYSHRTQCEIWNALDKPIGVDENVLL